MNRTLAPLRLFLALVLTILPGTGPALAAGGHSTSLGSGVRPSGVRALQASFGLPRILPSLGPGGAASWASPGSAIQAISQTALDAPAATNAAAPSSPQVVPQAQEQLRQALKLSPASAGESSPGSATQGEAGRAKVEEFWSGAGQRPEGGVPAEPPALTGQAQGLSTAKPGPRNASRPGELPPPSSAPKALTSLGGAAALIGAVLLFDWPQALEAVKPYATGVAFMIGTFMVDRWLRHAVTWLGKAWKWKDHRTAVVRWVLSAAAWASGIAWGLKALGAPPITSASAYGLGGISVTLMVKSFLGNFYHGLALLLDRPFSTGQNLIIDKKLYPPVYDMTLTELIFSRDGKTYSDVEYEEITSRPVFVVGDYLPANQVELLRSALSWDGAKRLTSYAFKSRASLAKPALWAGLAAGLIAVFPWLPLWIGWASLAQAVPYLQAGAVLMLARALESFAIRLIGKAAGELALSAHAAAVLKILARAMIYVAGGTIALRVAGLTWPEFLASVGATTVAVGFAIYDILINLQIAARIIKQGRLQVGQELEVGDFKGPVVALSKQYIVVKAQIEVDGQKHQGHAFLPYSWYKKQIKTHDQDYQEAAAGP